MSSNFALGTPLDSLDYRTDNEEILGYLVHGLAEWHFGDALLGADELEEFQKRLNEAKQASAVSTSASLDWLSLYSGLVDYYKPDFAPVRIALQPHKAGTLDELRAELKKLKAADDALEKTGAKKKRHGSYLASIAQMETALQREISRITLEQQQKQMQEDKKRRQADLELLAEINALVPSLVQGYDYSRAIEMLGDTRLETEDVRSALDSRLYLYTQSRDFIRQLTADLSTKGWNGTISRREGGQMTGRITCNTDGTTVNVTLERGTLSLPFESLTPETLVEIAQAFGTQITDSTDYYRRQENIAAFARLNGLAQLSATIAAQLMEENRSFRSRWMK